MNGQLNIGRFRFSLATLVWAIGVFAVGCAGLRYSTWAWAAAVTSMVACAQFVALIGVIVSRGETRASWAGFAAVSWGYLVLGAIDINQREGYLATNILLQFCVTEWELVDATAVPPGTPFSFQPDESHFIQIGHMTFTALFGIAGAVLAQYFYLRHEEDAPPPRRGHDEST